MAEPWLHIIGVGENGLAGLTNASLDVLENAEVIFGGPRHLALVKAGERGRSWPVPFSVCPVLEMRGRQVVALASGDPFWYGAGSSLAAHLAPGEWVAHPAPSTFSLAAARLGWPLEETCCIGLHATPLSRLKPLLWGGARLICLLRDAESPARLGAYLADEGFAASRLWLLERLGGPGERIQACTASDLSGHNYGITVPVAVAIAAQGQRGLSQSAGLSDNLFSHRGQITKAPIRALTLSALAPIRGGHLWDLGAGSGSVSVEWALAAPGATASAVEKREDRYHLMQENAARFGLEHRISIHAAAWDEIVRELPKPDSVFIGGGLSAESFERLWPWLPAGVRLVANGVTLETEQLLIALQQEKGGRLMRFEVSESQPLGSYRSWQAARPVTQWSLDR